VGHHAASETDQTVHSDAKRWGGWSWREPHHGEHFRRCDFCGSIHPEDLAAEPHWEANWSDMKYGWPHKFYVDIPNREPDRLFVTSTAYSDTPPQPLGNTAPYVPAGELTADQLAIVERDGHRPDPSKVSAMYYQFGPRPHHFGKFYTIHLRDKDLNENVKAVIERRCGLAFEFRADGTLAWHPTT
jgi:hypothetical protein